MNQRFLMWGLASITFVVTLAITSWHDGLWQSDETVTPAHNVRTASFTTEETVDMPARPFAPEHAVPPPPVETVAAVTPPPPPPPEPAPQETPAPAVEPEQVSAQELDEQEFQSHRDRASEHSARSR